ncbi:MAG: hypothetical protein K0R50_4307 [Eubacterium sp.]|nr:hypothetical protein [Eubacterium sp.]
MKKICVILICLGFIFIFVGCSSNKNENKSISTAAGQSSADETETDINNTNSVQSQADSSQNEQPVKDENKAQQNEDKVIGKVKLFDGVYYDDRRIGDNILKDYCEVEISNITDTSFDFTVYEVNVEEGEKNKKVIFRTNTAVFTGDGMKAAFYGKKYTLEFTFPNYHNAEPLVTDIEISGFEPLEGKTYANNGIPGHEFS